MRIHHLDHLVLTVADIERSYIYAPVPEPAGIALWSAGPCALLVTARRKNQSC